MTFLCSTCRFSDGATCTKFIMPKEHGRQMCGGDEWLAKFETGNPLSVLERRAAWLKWKENNG